MQPQQRPQSIPESAPVRAGMKAPAAEANRLDATGCCPTPAVSAATWALVDGATCWGRQTDPRLCSREAEP